MREFAQVKARYLFVAILPLMLAACGDGSDGGNQTVGPESGDAAEQPAVESRLQKEAREWAEETEELGAAAWDATKEQAREYTKKSKEYYDSAKDASAVYYEQAREQIREYREQAMSDAAKKKGVEDGGQAMEQTREYYEQALQQPLDNGGQSARGAEVEVERPEGHLPQAGAEVEREMGAELEPGR